MARDGMAIRSKPRDKQYVAHVSGRVTSGNSDAYLEEKTSRRPTPA
jgi:hypothetical protein